MKTQYSDLCVSLQQVYEWIREVQSGFASVEDALRPGQAHRVVTNENIAAAEALVRENMYYCGGNTHYFEYQCWFSTQYVHDGSKRLWEASISEAMIRWQPRCTSDHSCNQQNFSHKVSLHSWSGGTWASHNICIIFLHFFVCLIIENSGFHLHHPCTFRYCMLLKSLSFPFGPTGGDTHGWYQFNRNGAQLRATTRRKFSVLLGFRKPAQGFLFRVSQYLPETWNPNCSEAKLKNALMVRVQTFEVLR